MLTCHLRAAWVSNEVNYYIAEDKGDLDDFKPILPPDPNLKRKKSCGIPRDGPIAIKEIQQHVVQKSY